jgi:hypothetical protein
MVDSWLLGATVLRGRSLGMNISPDYAGWVVIGVVLSVGTAASAFAWFGGKYMESKYIDKHRDKERKSKSGETDA